VFALLVAIRSEEAERMSPSLVCWRVFTEAAVKGAEFGRLGTSIITEFCRATRMLPPLFAVRQAFSRFLANFHEYLTVSQCRAIVVNIGWE